MATKPRPAAWEDLNDLRGDLLEWLVAQKLAAAKDSPLTAVFKVQSKPFAQGPLASAVAEVLFEIEMFFAAGHRADGDKLKKLDELAPARRRLLTGNSLEREADRSVRSLLPTLRHIERLSKKMADKQIKLAKAQRSAPDMARIELQQDLVAGLVAQLEKYAHYLHRVFLRMNPSAPPDGLTLAGYRRFEKRIRQRLIQAGFPSAKLASRA